MDSKRGICTVDACSYPLARKDETVVDDYHGTKICDPYRWLEDPDAAETADYIKQLNAVSHKFFEQSSLRENIRQRLMQLWDYEKCGNISKHGNYYYYYHNTGLQNQYVLYQQTNYEETGEVFLDPNKFSEDGSVSILLQSFSKDGSIFAYGLSEKGSDWITLHFRTAEGVDLEDRVTKVKHSSLSWLSDNSGVFYSKYPEVKGSAEGSSAEKQEYHSLYFHKIGTSENEDILVADFRENPNLMCDGEVSEDGRFLIVSVRLGTDPNNKLYYYDLSAVNNKITGKLELKTLFDKSDARYEYIDNEGDDSIIIMTSKLSPLYRLVKVKISNENLEPEDFETLIPEHEQHLLESVSPAGKRHFVVTYVEDVKSALYLYSRSGENLSKIDIPIGTVVSIFCKKKYDEAFILFQSFFTPTIVYRLDIVKPEVAGLLEIKRANVPGIDFNNFVVKQEFVTSKDGTKIPLYIMHKKNIELNGDNPTILYGYGGFNICLFPFFSVSRINFLQNFNGIVAQSNLRGGSEYGEKWHEAGMRERKQNVFDDFIASAEYLISQKYTSPKRLAIQGGSNGGLLVAACSQQRPDLFGAVISQVGVLDMLRYHKFTIGSAWIAEYGDPDIAADFEFLIKYSPLHNIKLPECGEWPPTLLMTADHDDRVVPSHSLKYIARLYEEIKNCNSFHSNPVLIRVEERAGHGAGKPTCKIIQELVDLYCFLHQVIGLEWND